MYVAYGCHISINDGGGDKLLPVVILESQTSRHISYADILWSNRLSSSPLFVNP